MKNEALEVKEIAEKWGFTTRRVVQLCPLSKNRPGILMEFKASENADEDHLSKLADEAMVQVKEKQYFAELKAIGVIDIEIYGIAFGEKKATVKTDRLSF